MPKKKYISIKFNQDKLSEEIVGSLVALPGVYSVSALYPEDPALFNIYLLSANQSDYPELLETVRNFEPVDFAEIVDEPEIRK